MQRENIVLFSLLDIYDDVLILSYDEKYKNNFLIKSRRIE